MSVQRKVHRVTVWVLSSDAALGKLVSFGFSFLIYNRRGLNYNFFKL